MAQVVVDSNVMRDKSNTLKTSGEKILSLYNEMLQEINSTTGKMKGTTIETIRKQFAGMQSIFDTFNTDLKKYSEFLTSAADGYEAAEQKGTQRAQTQGRPF